MGKIGKAQNAVNQGHAQRPQRQLAAIGRRRNNQKIAEQISESTKIPVSVTSTPIPITSTPTPDANLISNQAIQLDQVSTQISEINLKELMIEDSELGITFSIPASWKKEKKTNDEILFLGDHGSTGLGYIVSWNLIYLSQETDLITPVSALWFIFFPLTDTVLIIIRRIRSSKSIFVPDRKHIHYFLSDSGYSDIKILSIIVSISFVTGFIGVASNYWQIKEYYLLYGYLTLLIFFIILGVTRPEKS